MREPRVDATGTGHVFGAPTGDYMGITCFQNGSLARERVRDELGTGLGRRSRARSTTTPPGNGTCHAAVVRAGDHAGRADARRAPVRARSGRRRGNVRAVVEAQMMAMALHSRWMGVEVDTIHATGGAAANRAILQVMADVFGADVYQLEVGNSAALGAALRAAHADLRGEPLDTRMG